ncbi:LAQU0S07e00540g1_1 [Lachancea quebecensis]|uniref:LAQU0S07e00540g1_1 n=1 Tax=Lachancea quebecensis TaxID=1654605 RepID=A0A0P1KS56_9SACH|nr:LAQU0S07e00540g1_1 [Lachancea quebecensis]
MTDEAGYGEFAASEDENYDDFMASDEDVSIEMEDETEDEADQELANHRDDSDYGSDSGGDSGRDVGHGGEKPGAESTAAAMAAAALQSAKRMVQEQRWHEARSALNGILQGSTLDPDRAFEARLQLAQCCYLSWLSHRECAAGPAEQDELQEVCDHLQQLHTFAEWVEPEVLDSAVAQLLDQFAPPLKSKLLFEGPAASASNPQVSAALLECCAPLARHDYAQELRSRVLQYQLGFSDNTDESQRRQRLDELAAISGSRLDSLEFLIAMHVQHFLANPQGLDVPQLQSLVTRSSALLQKSLTEPLRLLSLLSFCEAIIALNNYCSPHDHAKRLSECQTAFWNCYKHLEELGDHSRFRDLTLCAFILSSMLLTGQAANAHQAITPFELEQIKVIESTPLVQDLKQIYADFVGYNLSGFANSLRNIQRFHLQLAGLIDAIIHLLQTRMLWNRVARLYSCISLVDIRAQLQIGDCTPLSRNDLLTILMKSIMNDTAQVYFKLDLTHDLVYFGKENRRPLCPLSKHLYLSTKSDAATRTLNTASSPSFKEWVDNIGVFETKPRRLKDMSAVQFVHELQQSRECTAVADSSCQAKPLKYSQLLQCVRDALS